MVAQTVQACLGLIPSGTHALGVSIDGPAVNLILQIREWCEEAAADWADIVEQLQDLLGPEVAVSSTVETRDAPRLGSPDPNTRWVYRVND